MRVAIVDDETVLAQACSTALPGPDFECEIFNSGEDIVSALRRTTFDLVLLDWKMPGMSGIDVLEWAHETLDSPPSFIMLTSKGDPESVVRGLEAGAVDYIIKPEADVVIRARVNAAARRVNLAPAKERREFGRYVVDDIVRSVFLDGEDKKLTAKEYALASIFFDNVDRPLARDYLLRNVWGSSDQVETRTLDMHVSKLRSKLQLKPQQGYVIQTVFGFGYRFSAFEHSGDF